MRTVRPFGIELRKTVGSFTPGPAQELTREFSGETWIRAKRKRLVKTDAT